MHENSIKFASRRLVVSLFALVLLVIALFWWWLGTNNSNFLASKGVRADQISLRQYDGKIQWQFLDGEWQDIIAISELRGQNGSDGADGKDGADGATGPTGAAGQDGQDGADGADGAQGPAGPAGATGATGATGPTGAAGQDGQDGADGREIELQKSTLYIQWRYVGDTTWNNLVALTDLKGDKGDTGDTGPAGATGAQGIQGPQGIQGIQGIQGPQGVKGDKGDSGVNVGAIPIAGYTSQLTRAANSTSLPGQTIGTEYAVGLSIWPGTYDRIGLQVATAGTAGTVLRIGLRPIDMTTGRPGAPVVDVAVDVSATGDRYVSFSPVSLSGLYAITWTRLGDATSNTLRVQKAGILQTPGLISLAFATNNPATGHGPFVSRINENITGALPVTTTIIETSTFLEGESVPAITIRRVS